MRSPEIIHELLPWRPGATGEDEEGRVLVPASVCRELATILTGAELRGFFLLVETMRPGRPIVRAPFLPWTDGRPLVCLTEGEESPSLRVMRNMVSKATRAGILHGCRFGRIMYYTIFQNDNAGP